MCSGKKEEILVSECSGRCNGQTLSMDGVQVGDCVAITGMVDGIWYNLWGMKEPDYMIKMMVCGGNLQSFDSCRETVCY